VPLLATAWDWDLRSLSRGVEEDTSWAVQRLVPSGSAAVAVPGAGAGPQSMAQSLRDADVLVARYDSRALTPERSVEVCAFSSAAGVCSSGPIRRTPSVAGSARPGVGLEWHDFNSPAGPSSGIELTPAGRAHEISLLGGDAATATATWRALPPVQVPVVLNVSGGALAPLLVARFGTETVPLLLAGRVGAGRVAVLNGAGCTAGA